jgi:hypothetical protein
METKYIVNNLSGQTINGDITINGNLTITGSTSSSDFAIYRALLTQTGPISGTSIDSFNYGLIIGDTYTITTYQSSDDFSNIANVQSGTINETGCVFIATGETPNNWTNGSELVSNGDLVVDVLENTLGYDLSWQQTPFGGNGYYIGINGNTGPLYNSFPRSKTEISTQFKYPFNIGPFGFPPVIVPSISTFIDKDSLIAIDVYYEGNLVDNALYYTPVNIIINQDPLTPVVAYGQNVSSFPYGNISIDIFAGSNFIETIFGDYSLVNNINELATALNNDPTISYLGTFSVNNEVSDGLILTTTERIKNQFSPNNTLTFNVFND